MTCIVCQAAEATDGRTVCDGCLARIDHDLERIAELTRHAADRLIPETRPGNGGRSVPGSRPPLDVVALDDACGVDTLRHLEDWCRLIREEAGLARYGAATEAERVTVGSSVQWLRSWLLWASERPDFPTDDLAREMRELRAGLEHYDPAHTGDAHGTRLRCPSDHPDGDGRLCHARIVYDRERPRDDIGCPRCGTTWTGARLLLLALSDDTQVIWAYAADVIALTDINASTLRVWAHRGVVARDGARYDIGQVWRARMRVGA